MLKVVGIIAILVKKCIELYMHLFVHGTAYHSSEHSKRYSIGGFSPNITIKYKIHSNTDRIVVICCESQTMSPFVSNNHIAITIDLENQIIIEVSQIFIDVGSQIFIDVRSQTSINVESQIVKYS